MNTSYQIIISKLPDLLNTKLQNIDLNILSYLIQKEYLLKIKGIFGNIDLDSVHLIVERVLREHIPYFNVGDTINIIECVNIDSLNFPFNF